MKIRTRIGIGLKIAVSAALIYWILKDANFRQIFATISAANKPLLVLAFSTFFVGYLLTALRWRLLLSAQGVVAPLGYLFRSFMVAMFFSNFLPSTMGGDGFRMYVSWRLGKSKSRAASVIFVDRLLGLLALAVLAVIGMMFATPLTEALPALPLWITALVGGAAVLAYMIFRPPEALLRYSVGAHDSIPGVFQRLIAKIVDAFNLFKGRHDVLWRAMLMSFALQTAVVIHYYIVSMALGFNVPFSAFFLFVPVAIVVMMLPISINGIGVREGIFALLLSAYGIDSDAAIAMAWVAYGFVLLQGLLGGLMFTLHKDRTVAAGSSNG